MYLPLYEISRAPHGSDYKTCRVGGFHYYGYWDRLRDWDNGVYTDTVIHYCAVDLECEK